jgi:FAD/FMN-containing dehydrogenase
LIATIDFQDFAAIVGDNNVDTSPDARALHSQDIWAEGALCGAVVSPANQEQAAACLRLAAQRKLGVNVRGGGMSYTGGYAPREAGGVTLDLSRLNRIVLIDAENMAVTVECGVTWAALDAALSPLGLRTPFWGPFSGRVSTIGGALSQNALFFGSGLYGSAADSVLGLKVALADGAIVHTGAGATPGSVNFFRHYGPDLTGLFTGDAGAFGVKLQATLRLIARPASVTFASFDMPSHTELLSIMHTIAREQLASECFAFDPFLQAMRLRRESLSKDFAALKSVMKSEGIGAGLRMAVTGRKAVEAQGFALHVICEDRTEEAAASRIARVEQIALASGARSIEPTLPRVARAMPFGPLNGMLGAGGERWVPVHGILAHTKCEPMLADWDQLLRRRGAEMAYHRIETGYMLCTIQSGATLIEPVFYWPDARTALHEQSVAADFLANVATFPPAPETRSLVASLRAEVIEMFANHGAAHFQVGKTYPCFETRAPQTAILLDNLKTLLDPDGRLNVGVFTVESGAPGTPEFRRASA